MSLTIKEIRERVVRVEPSSGWQGCFDIDPPLALRCKIDISCSFHPIKKGEIVHATSFDENGKHPNTVRLKERAFWWLVDGFEIA